MSSEKLRVLHLVSNLQQNGPAVALVDLLAEFVERGHKVVLGSGGGPLCSRLPQSVELVGLPIDRNKARLTTLPIDLAAALAKTLEVCRQNEVQVIHCHQRLPIVVGYAASRLLNIPLVTTHQNLFALADLRNYPYRLGDHFVAVSQGVRDNITSSFGTAEKVALIYNSIRELPPVDYSAARARILEEFRFPGDAQIGCMVAGLRPQKGIEFFLQAVSRIRLSNSRLRFLVVGDAHPWEMDYKRHLLSLAANLKLQGTVVFTGFRDDARDILAGSDVFVLSSLYEGLSLALLEAMALGKPVVCTRVSGSAEAVVPEVTGTLVDAGDSEALAEALLRLSSNGQLVARAGEAARERFREMFNATRAAEQLEAVYRRVLAQRLGRRAAL